MELYNLRGLQADVLIGGDSHLSWLDEYVQKRLEDLDCPFHLEINTLTFKKGPIDPKVAQVLKEFAIEVNGYSMSGEFNSDYDFLWPCERIIVNEGEVTVETEQAKEDMIKFMKLLFVVECDHQAMFKNMPWLPEELCFSTPERKERVVLQKKRKALEKNKKKKKKNRSSATRAEQAAVDEE